MKARTWLLMSALVLCVASSWTQERAAAQDCVGDCNGDNAVLVGELITGVNIILGSLPLDRCRILDRGGDGAVSIDELIAAVANALVGCASPANRAPQASDVSLTADLSSPYVEKQLIGHDPDNDTITYELIADDVGTGYSFAYVNPESGVLYLTIAPGFEGEIALPYHVTDGRLFSNTATATIQVQAGTDTRNTGSQPVDPKEYAGYPRGFFVGTLLGAPGANPTLPSAVDLSKDFPLPGDQGPQNSCVGWALAYAIKSYQERVELGWSLEAPEHRFSPSYIYNQINGGVDRGSIYRDALDLVVDQGIATLATMPYIPADFLTQPSFAARQEAAQFKMFSWNTANGIIEIKDALANHLPVFVIVQIFGDLLHLKGPNSVYNTFGGAYDGQHAVAAVGYDDTRYGGALRLINSWSQNWGDGGYFWLPYSSANQTVQTPTGPQALMPGAVVLQDMQDPMPPPTDPVDPPLPAELPDLQVTNWTANYDERPRGAGTLQYTVTNTGTATAPAGAYVALLLSHDPAFTAGNTLVVYEPIPFDMPPGTTAYRDQNNAIAFNFPDSVAPGEYYMAVWADIWNDVVESKENDNISPAATTIQIVNTLPDMQVRSWYSVWDSSGDGLLTYDVINNGAASAPAGWLVTLALSRDDIIGDGDEIFVFAEPANFALAPGGTLYRDDSIPAAFSIVTDYLGNPVPTGVYYVALWLDPNNALAESNEINNASLSWGSVAITSAARLSSAAGPGGANASGEPVAATSSAGDAYNGKALPEASVRKVRISEMAQGGRRVEFLDGGVTEDSAPRGRSDATHTWSKVAGARQQVIFPVTDSKPMP
jgi:hypothetical protein